MCLESPAADALCFQAQSLAVCLIPAEETKELFDATHPDRQSAAAGLARRRSCGFTHRSTDRPAEVSRRRTSSTTSRSKRGSGRPRRDGGGARSSRPSSAISWPGTAPSCPMAALPLTSTPVMRSFSLPIRWGPGTSMKPSARPMSCLTTVSRSAYCGVHAPPVRSWPDAGVRSSRLGSGVGAPSPR